MQKQTQSVQWKAISSDVQTKLIRHDKTDAEEKFNLDFLLYLRRIGFSGEVHFRCFLVDRFGRVRRPDVYLPRYGIAIEIDGVTRQTWQRRVNDSERRDKFYEELGCQPLLIIEATSVVSDFKMKQFKYRFDDFRFKNRLTPKRVGLINKNLSIGRKAYAVKNPGIFNSHGTPALQMLPEMALNGFNEIHHFGGTKVILRAKYETKAIKLTEEMSKRFKTFLKMYFGKISAEQEEKATKFAIDLVGQNPDHNQRIASVEAFALSHGLDFPSLANAVAKLHALY